MEFLSKVNDTIPEIFGEIIKTYDFKVERITSSATLLYKEDSALYLASDRDYVNISFLKKEENKIMNYWLHPFLMENLTEEDRSNTKKEDDLVKMEALAEMIAKKVIELMNGTGEEETTPEETPVEEVEQVEEENRSTNIDYSEFEKRIENLK